MTNPDETTRRDFIRRVGVGAVAAAGVAASAGAEVSKRTQTLAKGRILGANDRINVGFVGCGGRMNAHLRRIPRYALVAAPDYLARHGRPKHTRDLLNHACIRVRFSSGALLDWEFEKAGRKKVLDSFVTAG